jgi:hypothetical protein
MLLRILPSLLIFALGVRRRHSRGPRLVVSRVDDHAGGVGTGLAQLDGPLA